MRILYKPLPALGRIKCPFCKKLNRLNAWPQKIKTCAHYDGTNTRCGYVRFINAEATADGGAVVPLLP